MNRGIVEQDFIAQDARYIFSMTVACHKGKKPLDYGKAAVEAFKAAEAVYSAGIVSGHIQFKGVVP